MKININTLLKIILLILIFFLGLYLLKISFPYIKIIIGLILPFIIGFTFSFVLQPCINYLIKLKINRSYAILIVISILILLLIVFGIFLIPMILKELNIFFINLPEFINEVSELINNVGIIKKIGIDFKEIFNNFIKSKSDIIKNIFNFFTSIFSYLIPTITTPILIIYFTIYYKKIEEYIKDKFSDNQKIFNILREIKISMYDYFRSYFIITLVLFVSSSIAFAALKIDYFIIWGLIIGLTNIIPYIGPYIGGGIVGLYVLTTTPNLLLYVIIIIVCLQLIESSFLTPKIQGDIMEINPILVIFSVTFFGELLGIFGMIIAVPVVRILQIIIKYEKINKKRYN